MPLEICKKSRASRSKICKENPYATPNIDYCASQQMYYYGYKLHAVCSTNGVFTSFDLTAASVHDVNYLKDIKYDYCDCTVIGDISKILSLTCLQLINMNSGRNINNLKSCFQ